MKQKEWVQVNDLFKGKYSINKNIRFKTSMLRSDFCDYSEVYIVLKGIISVMLHALMVLTEEITSLSSKIILSLDHA